MDDDFSANDFGREPSNGITITKLLLITVFIIILTCIIGFIFYYVYVYYNTGNTVSSYNNDNMYTNIYNYAS